MMEKISTKFRINTLAIYMIVVFVGLMIFFTVAYPLVPFDGDDWANLGLMRVGLPKPGAWNPGKILPETSFPLVGLIAAYGVTPFVGDYVDALTWLCAVVYCLVITGYIWLFTRWIQDEMQLTLPQTIAVSLCFLVAHFLIFRSVDTGNRYLFGSANLTCIFHYAIPAILNAMLVLYAWRRHIHGGSNVFDNPWRGGMLLLAIYAALFTNVLSDMNFIMYLSVLMLWKYKTEMFSPRRLLQIVRENKFFVVVLLLWFVMLAVEATGGRARAIGAPLIELPIMATAKNLFTQLRGINHFFLASSLVTILLAGITCYRKRGNEWVEKFLYGAKICIPAGVITIVYLLLVSAKASPGYIGREDVLINIAFWALLLVALAFACLMKCYAKLTLLVPVVLFIVTVELCKVGGYRETNVPNISPVIASQISKDLVQQIKEADQAGLTEMTLIVPKGDNRDNWPHPMYMGKNISRTLYRHGVITKQMQIEIKPDTAMNEKYHIPVPK